MPIAIDPATAITIATSLASLLKKKGGGGGGAQEPTLVGGPPVTNPLPPPGLGENPEDDVSLQMMLMQMLQGQGGGL